jgi:mono/diheme cytochrome c family protein
MVVALLGLLGAGRMLIAAQSPSEAAPAKNPVAATAESIAAGKSTYLRSCASCHGASGEGGPGNDLIPAAPSLVESKLPHGSTDGEIFSNIKNGVAPDFDMVPFKDKLSDEQIWNVVNHVRSIAKK